MAHKNTIPVEAEAHGFEDAAEKIELMADAIDSLPATINIKTKDCKVNVHTMNIIEQQKPPIEECAPKGFYVADGFKPKPDYEPEVEMLNRLILKIPPVARTSKTEQELRMLAQIKNRCKSRNECEGCCYNVCEMPGMSYCVLSGIPDEWQI